MSTYLSQDTPPWLKAPSIFFCEVSSDCWITVRMWTWTADLFRSPKSKTGPILPKQVMYSSDNICKYLMIRYGWAQCTWSGTIHPFPVTLRDDEYWVEEPFQLNKVKPALWDIEGIVMVMLFWPKASDNIFPSTAFYRISSTDADQLRRAGNSICLRSRRRTCGLARRPSIYGRIRGR